MLGCLNNIGVFVFVGCLWNKDLNIIFIIFLMYMFMGLSILGLLFVFNVDGELLKRIFESFLNDFLFEEYKFFFFFDFMIGIIKMDGNIFLLIFLEFI